MLARLGRRTLPSSATKPSVSRQSSVILHWSEVCTIPYKMDVFHSKTPKQSKNLDLPYKTDLDFWDYFGRLNLHDSKIS